MIPTNKINIGDNFYRTGDKLMYVVIDMDNSCVLLQSVKINDGKEFKEPFWVKNTNLLINERFIQRIKK